MSLVRIEFQIDHRRKELASKPISFSTSRAIAVFLLSGEPSNIVIAFDANDAITASATSSALFVKIISLSRSMDALGRKGTITSLVLLLTYNCPPAESFSLWRYIGQFQLSNRMSAAITLCSCWGIRSKNIILCEIGHSNRRWGRSEYAHLILLRVNHCESREKWTGLIEKVWICHFSGVW